MKKTFSSEIYAANAQIKVKFGRNRMIRFVPIYAKVIFSVLMKNVLKSKLPNRKLEIAVLLEQQNGFAILTFRDNGVGMDNEMRQLVFEPFRKKGDQFEYSGYGLSLIHNIVQRSGGKTEVESQMGKGTAFKIFFPKRDSEKKN